MCTGEKREALHSRLCDVLEHYLHTGLVEVATRANIGKIMDAISASHGVPVDIPEVVALRDTSLLHTFTLTNSRDLARS